MHVVARHPSWSYTGFVGFTGLVVGFVVGFLTGLVVGFLTGFVVV